MMHLELKLGISLKTLEENMLTCLSDSHFQYPVQWFSLVSKATAADFKLQ